MIAYLLITHDDLGDALLASATHVLGSAPEQVRVLKVRAGEVHAGVLERAREAAATLDTRDGLIILVDIYGATPSNVACKMLDLSPHVEAFAGLNLPMLVKALAYRNLPFEQVVAKTLEGALRGIVQISKDPCHAANG